MGQLLSTLLTSFPVVPLLFDVSVKALLYTGYYVLEEDNAIHTDYIDAIAHEHSLLELLIVYRTEE